MDKSRFLTRNSVLLILLGFGAAVLGHAITKASNRPNVNPTELETARQLVRQAQWYWDYVAAANSMGFHNQTQELNTLGQAIDLAHRAIDSANRAAGTNSL